MGARLKDQLVVPLALGSSPKTLQPFSPVNLRGWSPLTCIHSRGGASHRGALLGTSHLSPNTTWLLSFTHCTRLCVPGFARTLVLIGSRAFFLGGVNRSFSRFSQLGDTGVLDREGSYRALCLTISYPLSRITCVSSGLSAGFLLSIPPQWLERGQSGRCGAPAASPVGVATGAAKGAVWTPHPRMVVPPALGHLRRGCPVACSPVQVTQTVSRAVCM